ncbi:hypothetical protein TNCV_764621 [Trichonephila clavipes]|nr:hypothetical protein TNCV_764621 [Trichonephila clavipes]
MLKQFTRITELYQGVTQKKQGVRQNCGTLCVTLTRSVVWTGKEAKEKWKDKKRVENREESLGYPGFGKPVFTKDSKPLGKIGKDH